MTKEIQLTQNKVALVSDHRYEYLSRWKWHAMKCKKTWYAVRREGGKQILMHRVIVNATEGVLADHWDGDGLNNVDENLRCATYLENAQNRGLGRNSSTGFKGVSLDKARQKYKAYIQPNGRYIHLGFFDTPEQAARAHDRAAVDRFGKFARTNFPVESVS